MEHQNKFESNKKYFTISIYTLFVILVGSLLIRSIFLWDSTKAVLDEAMSAISPYLFGAFIAFVVCPLVNLVDQKLFGQLLHMKKNGWRYILAVLLTYLSLIGLFSLFFVFLVPEIWQSAMDLGPSLSNGYTSLVNFLHELDAKYPEIDLTMLYTTLEANGQNLFNIEFLKDTLFNLLPMVFNTSIGLVKWLFNLLISLVVSIYILWDRGLAAKAARKLAYSLFPRNTANRLIHHLKICGKMFSGFITGKLIDSTIIGILCFILMKLLQMPEQYILLISLVVGVTNMIPFFGPFMGGFAGGFIILVVAPEKVFVFALLILALQQFDGLLLGPKILGDVIGIRPVFIIISVSVGGAIAGVWGMFLGVPVIASLLYLLNCYESYRLKEKGLTLDDETGRPV